MQGVNLFLFCLRVQIGFYVFGAHVYTFARIRLLQADGNYFFRLTATQDYEKYGGKTHTQARADIDEETANTINGYAKALADAICLRHLARIDFFLSGGKVYFNEINTFPGFTRESLYPKMLERYGVNPKDAMLSFIEDALSC